MHISPITYRRFILGKPGLYPGQRWQGKVGVEAALHTVCIVQVDLLAVVAHNHDIVLYEFELDYRLAHLHLL